MTTTPDHDDDARDAHDQHGVGIGVDREGHPVVDPTANVIALSAAANKRQDDLRLASDALTVEKIAHLTTVSILRAEHAREIRMLESDRLDKIRQVDVLAVNTAADRALAAIQTLAAQTTANAEQLRQMVAQTATTIATQTAGTVSAITERIAALEKSSYTGIGKAGATDPMLGELVNEMKALRALSGHQVGKDAGISASWGVLLAVVGLIATLITIGGAAVSFALISRNPSEAPAPQIIYTPSPAGTLLPSTPPTSAPR